MVVCVVGASAASGQRETAAASVDTTFWAAPALDDLPTYEALDAGAEELRPLVERLLRAEIERTADEMGWRPNYPIVVTIATEAASAALNAERKGIPASLAVNGRSFVRTMGFGEKQQKTAQVELHLIRANQRSEIAIRNVLAHEWTHVAQGGLSLRPDLTPHWFQEGQAEYQEARRGGYKGGTLLRAIHDQRSGVAVSLLDLGTSAQWNAMEATGKESLGYSRGYAAVRYLAQLYGFDATTDLLRRSRQEQSTFWSLLKDRTGLEPDAFDRRIGEYLQGFSLRQSESDSGDVRVISMDAPEWKAKALLLDIAPTAPCREGIFRRSPLAPTGGARIIPPTSDALMESWIDDGHTMQTFMWAGADGELSGVLYVDDLSVGCKSGPIKFGPARMLTGVRKAGQLDFVGQVAADGRSVKLLVSDGQSLLCGGRETGAGSVRTWTPFEATLGESGSLEFSRRTSSADGSVVSIQGTIISQKAVDVEFRWENAKKSCSASSWKAELR